MKKTERTKAHIIRQTAPVFNKKGFAGTSLSDLTSATGLSKGSIYGNFKDKNEVAIEAFRYNLKLLTERVNAEMDGLEKSSDKLLHYVDYHRHNYEPIFEMGGCAILNTSVDSDDGNPDLRSEVVKAINSWRRTIQRIVDQGIENGELKKVDSEDFAIGIIASIEGGIMLAKATGKFKYLEINLDHIENRIRETIL